MILHSGVTLQLVESVEYRIGLHNRYFTLTTVGRLLMPAICLNYSVGLPGDASDNMNSPYPEITIGIQEFFRMSWLYFIKNRRHLGAIKDLLYHDFVA